jgi:hypothetical protein
MSQMADRHRESEDRRGTRIDFPEGVAIWVSPETTLFQARRVSTEPGAVQRERSGPAAAKPMSTSPASAATNTNRAPTGSAITLRHRPVRSSTERPAK